MKTPERVTLELVGLALRMGTTGGLSLVDRFVRKLRAAHEQGQITPIPGMKPWQRNERPYLP